MNRVLRAWIIFSCIAFGCQIAGLWYPPVRTAWIGAFIIFTWIVLAHVQAMPKQYTLTNAQLKLHWEDDGAHIEVEGKGGTMTMQLTHENAERLRHELGDPRRQ